MDAAELSFQRAPAGESPARELLAAMEAELVEMYDFGTLTQTPSATPADFGGPGAGFLVGYRGERAVACGGIKRIGTGVGEIKRMYVIPEERSNGHARRLLGALEDLARELGHSLVRLDTGNRQPHALALYSTAGFREVPDYNDNAYASYWFEKDL